MSDWLPSAEPCSHGPLDPSSDAIAHALLRRDPARHGPGADVTLLERLGLRDASGKTRIRCPLCDWSPRRSDRWYCSDCRSPEIFYGGCGTLWNTFETHGLCPGCQHQWQWTSCLACGQWSPHEDWYVEEPGDGPGEPS